jgi:hypothetical protein
VQLPYPGHFARFDETGDGCVQLGHQSRSRAVFGRQQVLCRSVGARDRGVQELRVCQIVNADELLA